MNVLTGKRWQVVPQEMKDYIKGYYGKAPGPMDKEIVTKVLGDEAPLSADIRPGSLVTTTFDEVAAEIGDLARSEEDVLMYALFPNEARTYLEKHQEGAEKAVFLLGEEIDTVREDDAVNISEIRELIKLADIVYNREPSVKKTLEDILKDRRLVVDDHPRKLTFDIHDELRNKIFISMILVTALVFINYVLWYILSHPTIGDYLISIMGTGVSVIGALIVAKKLYAGGKHMERDIATACAIMIIAYLVLYYTFWVLVPDGAVKQVVSGIMFMATLYAVYKLWKNDFNLNYELLKIG
jgi:hypothetical protein